MRVSSLARFRLHMTGFSVARLRHRSLTVLCPTMEIDDLLWKTGQNSLGLFRIAMIWHTLQDNRSYHFLIVRV